MVKKSNEQLIQTFLDELRNESAYRRPCAIYEHGVDGDELIGFAAFIEGVLNFFGKDSRVTELVPYPAMGLRGIAAHGGGDYAVAL